MEKNEKGYVVATCRNPKEATSLIDLKNSFSERLFIQKVDVTDETTIEVIVSTLKICLLSLIKVIPCGSFCRAFTPFFLKLSSV